MPPVSGGDRATFAGLSWSLRDVDASAWVRALSTDIDGLSGVFPGLIDGGEDVMLALLIDMPDAEARRLLTARKVLGRGSGRDWWWTQNLVKRILGSWTYINGFMVREGVRAAEHSFPDWLDAAYTRLWEGLDEKARVRFETEMLMPPPGVQVTASLSEQKRGAMAFAAD